MNAISTRARLCVVFAVLSLVAPVGAHAQSAANSGQITGQVVDPSRAAIPDVTVMVRIF
jgi:hypothetical protein